MVWALHSKLRSLGRATIASKTLRAPSSVRCAYLRGRTRRVWDALVGQGAFAGPDEVLDGDAVVEHADGEVLHLLSLAQLHRERVDADLELADHGGEVRVVDERLEEEGSDGLVGEGERGSATGHGSGCDEGWAVGRTRSRPKRRTWRRRSCCAVGRQARQTRAAEMRSRRLTRGARSWGRSSRGRSTSSVGMPGRAQARVRGRGADVSREVEVSRRRGRGGVGRSQEIALPAGQATRVYFE